MLLDELYEIKSRSESEGSVVLSDAEHPVFKAHFPNNPILPGFVHLEIITELFDLKIDVIKKAKFSGFVKPLECLQYVKNGNRVRVFCAGNEVAQFNL